MDKYFSNLLIIHQKKMITVKEVWISHRFSLFEKIYQTLETVLHRLSKNLENRQKYSAARRIFNSSRISIS